MKSYLIDNHIKNYMCMLILFKFNYTPQKIGKYDYFDLFIIKRL